MSQCPEDHSSKSDQNFCKTCGEQPKPYGTPRPAQPTNGSSPVFKNGVLSGCLTALLIVGAILVGLFIDGYHMFRVQKGVTNAPRTPLGIRNAQRGLVQPVVH